MSDNFLIYGASGYTGTLIARLAVAQGLKPVLAGRNRAVLEKLAHQLGLEYRAFALDDATTIAQNLDGVTVVLNTAGPFSRTSQLLTQACITSGTHYLDIAGEVHEFPADLIVPTIKAFEGQNVLVVDTTAGKPLNAELIKQLPENVRVAEFLPPAQLLDIMITNGGYGAVQMALAHGIPIIIAGTTANKPEVAARIEWPGLVLA